jgi:hypothetical protein
MTESNNDFWLTIGDARRSSPGELIAPLGLQDGSPVLRDDDPSTINCCPSTALLYLPWGDDARDHSLSVATLLDQTAADIIGASNLELEREV